MSFISPSSGGSIGPVQPICEQRWPKTLFISFHFENCIINPGINTDYNNKQKINILYLRRD